MTSTPDDQAGFARALLDPAMAVPAGLSCWNGSDPGIRLAVHRNNVVSSLASALAETFPVVGQLVGDDFFHAMAVQFVRQSPPRSRILARYGAGFADFIGRYRPAEGLPYLADVARLEYSRVRAYHSADVPTVTRQEVDRALTSGERMAELTFELHPSLEVIESHFAIVSLWAAHQGEVDILAVDPSVAETAVIVRRDLDVLVFGAPAGARSFVDAVRARRGLAEAAAAATAADPEFDLAVLLGMLFRHCAITSIQLSEGA